MVKRLHALESGVAQETGSATEGSAGSSPGRGKPKTDGRGWDDEAREIMPAPYPATPSGVRSGKANPTSERARGRGEGGERA